MGVHLDVQVVSNSMVRLIKYYAEKFGGKEIYTSLSTMVSKLDKLVDIMNNTYVSNRRDKMVAK